MKLYFLKIVVVKLDRNGPGAIQIQVIIIKKKILEIKNQFVSSNEKNLYSILKKLNSF